MATIKYRKTSIILAVIFLMLTGISAYGAEYANPQLLVTPTDIEKNAGDWIVLDCRDVQSTQDKKTGETLKGYADGHIPGAITLGGNCSKVLREKETSTVFKDTKKYEEILGLAGIGNDRTVVVYGDTPRITNTTVGFWILEYLGQKDVRFLNGGIAAWEAAGKTLESSETKLPEAAYKTDINANRIATTEEVEKIATGSVKDTQIVDSRTPAEYRGEDVRTKKGGHVQSCNINVSHSESYDNKTGMIRSMDELEKLFGTLDKGKRAIPYCQTGTRSTLTYLVFRLMGFSDPANYDDSWIIWGNSESLPIEK